MRRMASLGFLALALAPVLVMALAVCRPAQALDVTVRDVEPETTVSGTLALEGEMYVLWGEDGTRYVLDVEGESFRVDPATGRLETVGPKLFQVSGYLGERVRVSGFVTRSASPLGTRDDESERWRPVLVLQATQIEPGR